MASSETRWQRADRLFSAALEIVPGDRPRFLDRECGDDGELRSLVERLLEAADDEVNLLASGGPWGGRLARSLGRELSAEEDLTGQLLGGYRLLRELGRGGMAVVYLAEREASDFHQLVALKVLQPGMDRDSVVRRFHLEKQILALARHPNIAHLLDAGVSDDGRAFIVMEYVEGQPIDVFCDAGRLTVRQRIRLFLKVARAVEYAHRNLVVHRDIKPSNILVTGDGDVKLLDFGIAKLLAGDQSDLTRTDVRAMTPAYASPEQIAGEAITTATDVYQLGMLLYILLTGCWPYPGGRGSDAAMMLAICNQPPGRPSSVVGGRASAETTSDESELDLAAVADLRRSEPGRLRRELAGDLDTIVLTALRKQPERRYASVAQMVGDVERYLDGRTISARPETLTYRLRTFVRRHAAASATALASLVVVVGMVVLYTVQVGLERDRARLEARKATEVASFLTDLFQVPAPTRSLGQQVTARELLDRGAARIDDELGDQPELQAEMMTVIGDVYRELAQYEEARRLLEEAVKIRRSGPDADSLELAETLHSLGRVLEKTRDLDEARQVLEEALELRTAVLGAGHPDVARTRDVLGQVEAADGNLEAARADHEEAVRVLESTVGPGHVDLGMALNRLAVVRQDQRAYPESIALFERAIAVLRRAVGEDHPHTAAAKFNLAFSLRHNGQPERAGELYEEVFPVLENVYGADHPNLGVVLNNHANLLRAQGHHDRAEELLQRSLDIWTRSLGGSHPQVGWVLNNLGLVERDRGDHEAARGYFARSVAIAETAYGPDHPDVATQLKNMAEELHALGRTEDAIPLMRRSLAIREGVYGARHSYVGAVAATLARMHLALGEPGPAEPLLRQAVAAGRDDAEHRLGEVTEPTMTLAACLVQLDRRDEARALLLEERARCDDEGRRRLDRAASRLGLSL